MSFNRFMKTSYIILLYAMLTAFSIAVIYIIFTKPDAHRMPIAVRSEHSAIRNTTLWSLVEEGSNHALVTLDFYDSEKCYDTE